MIKYSTNPTLIKKTFWELLHVNGRQGLLSLLILVVLCIVFTVWTIFSFLNTGFAKFGTLILFLLSIVMFFSTYTAVRVLWGKASGFFSENPYTDVELSLLNHQVQVRFDGDLTVLPWAAVALLRQTSCMILLEFEGLCCIGVPRQFINVEDMDLIAQNATVNDR